MHVASLCMKIDFKNLASLEVLEKIYLNVYLKTGSFICCHCLCQKVGSCGLPRFWTSDK